jgi:Response regulator containing CheY-like receiver, AAA-type ATPase, and DNA-binding domains
VLYVGPDHQTAAAALDEQLGRAQIKTVSSPAAALELLPDQPDCLVVAHTPGFDGLGLLRTVRNRARDLPVVLFPERGDEALATQALRVGATDYVRRTSDQPYALLAGRLTDVVSGADLDTDPDPAGTAVLYKSLFTHANDAVAMVTLAGDVPTIETANELFIEQFAPDADLSELVGRDIDTVVTPPDRRESARAITDRVHDGELVTEIVTRQTADGPRKFRFQAVPVDATELGAALRAFAIYTDITRRDRQQQRPEAQRKKIATLHETAADISRCGSAEAVYEEIVAAAEGILAFDTAIVNSAIDGMLVPQAISADLPADTTTTRSRWTPTTCCWHGPTAPASHTWSTISAIITSRRQTSHTGRC